MGEPKNPTVALRWDYRDRHWALTYITVHSYYLEMESGPPFPIGLEIDAVTGKVTGETPRAITGCFGPAPEPKKPPK
jgi:hypothetical protein